MPPYREHQKSKSLKSKLIVNRRAEPTARNVRRVKNKQKLQKFFRVCRYCFDDFSLTVLNPICTS